jgi:hypothetical protein
MEVVDAEGPPQQQQQQGQQQQGQRGQEEEGEGGAAAAAAAAAAATAADGAGTGGDGGGPDEGKGVKRPRTPDWNTLPAAAAPSSYPPVPAAVYPMAFNEALEAGRCVGLLVCVGGCLKSTGAAGTVVCVIISDRPTHPPTQNVHTHKHAKQQQQQARGPGGLRSGAAAPAFGHCCYCGRRQGGAGGSGWQQRQGGG